MKAMPKKTLIFLCATLLLAILASACSDDTGSGQVRSFPPGGVEADGTFGCAYSVREDTVYVFDQPMEGLDGYLRWKADPESFEVLDYRACFSRDKNQVFYGTYPVSYKPDDFRILGQMPVTLSTTDTLDIGVGLLESEARFRDSWATDGEVVYYNAIPQEEIDPATFRVIGHYKCGDYAEDYFFAADAANVYSGPGSKVAGADPASFKLLEGACSYAVDKNSLYFVDEAIPGADPESARAAIADSADHARQGTRFVTDKAGAYYDGNPIPGADPATFKLFSSNERFARDAKNIYWLSERLDGADPESFRPADGDYSIDAKRVYYTYKAIPEANPKNFHTWNKDAPGAPSAPGTPDAPYAHDGKHAYYQETPLKAEPAPDPGSFSPLDDKGVYAADSSNVYLKREQIPGADPESFEVLNAEIKLAKDKNSVYFYARKLAINAKDFRLLDKNVIQDLEWQRLIYATDAKNVYVLDSFSLLHLPDTVDFSSFRFVGDAGFSRDLEHIYYINRPLQGADADSFVFSPELTRRLGKASGWDRNAVWVGSDVVPDIQGPLEAVPGFSNVFRNSQGYFRAEQGRYQGKHLGLDKGFSQIHIKGPLYPIASGYYAHNGKSVFCMENERLVPGMSPRADFLPLAEPFFLPDLADEPVPMIWDGSVIAQADTVLMVLPEKMELVWPRDPHGRGQPGVFLQTASGRPCTLGDYEGEIAFLGWDTQRPLDQTMIYQVMDGSAKASFAVLSVHDGLPGSPNLVVSRDKSGLYLNEEAIPVPPDAEYQTAFAGLRWVVWAKSHGLFAKDLGRLVAVNNKSGSTVRLGVSGFEVWRTGRNADGGFLEAFDGRFHLRLDGKFRIWEEGSTPDSPDWRIDFARQ